MANPNDYVSVTISLTTPRFPSIQAFGVPLIAAYHTHYNDRVRLYSSLAAMVTDGFTTTEPAYLAAQVIFSAAQAPKQVAIGRRALAPLQVLNLVLTSVSALDTYTGTFIDSAGVSHTLSVPSTGVPTTDAATVATAITGFTLAGCTVSHVSATVTLTQTAGHLVDVRNFGVTTSGQVFNLSDTTADPGIATDLAAIQAANNLGWYGLVLDSNSKAEVLAAMAWVEATGIGGKFGFFNTADFACAAGTAGNVMLSAKAASYTKSDVSYSGIAVLNWQGAGAAAYALGQGPGTYTLAWKALPGVTVDNDQTLTETQAQAINSDSTSTPGTGGANGNYYRSVAGQNIFWPGVTPSGQWIDTMIGADALQVNAQANLFALVASLPKIPYDDFGIGLLADNLSKTIATYASPPAGAKELALIDGTRPIVITKPTAASVSVTDKGNRNLSGLSAIAYLAGAVNTIGVQITLSN